MDGKPNYVIATAKSLESSIRRSLLTLCFSTAILVAPPVPLAAQWGWAGNLNPWKQGTASGQTPTDPFAQRRGTPGPEYRMAARTVQQAAPQQTSYGAPAGSYSTPAYPVAPSMPVNYAPASYSAVGQYPSTGNPGYGEMNIAPASPYASYPPTTPQQAFVPQQTMAPAAPAPGRSDAGEAKPGEDLFEPAKIVAIINGQPILAGDILGPVNQMLEERLSSMPSEQRATVPPEELEKFREQALKQMLPGLIDIKVVYLDFMRSVPADRREEMEKVLEKNYDEYQLESDLKAAEVNTRAELDLKLRESGGSLDKKKRMFVEKLVAQQQIQQKVKTDEEVTHQQMLDYYNAHAADYETSARAQWEQLMVRFDGFPTRQAAWEAIANMGNQVLRGAPLKAVAQRDSQGIRASKGGQYDWTSKGSLKNETIDEVIFTLPVGELSPIIESPEGFHIVRVTQREEAGMVSFIEAQVKIKEQLKSDRRKAQMEAYLKEVKSKAQVWTIFDEAK